MTFRNEYVSACLSMILLANSFLQHYFFAVVQTTPLPTLPGADHTLRVRVRLANLAGYQQPSDGWGIRGFRCNA